MKPIKSRTFFSNILLLGVLLFGAYFLEAFNQERWTVQNRSALQSHLYDVRNSLETHLNSDFQLVKGLVAIVAYNPEIDQPLFARLGQELIHPDSSLIILSAAPDLVIRLLYPLKNNEAAMGLNLETHPEQSAAVLKARDTGKWVLAGPVNLVEGGVAFIARMPVFLNEGNAEKRFWGVVNALVDQDRLYEKSGLTDPELPIEIAIRGYDAEGAAGKVFFGRENIFHQDPVLTEIKFPSGSWQLAAVSKSPLISPLEYMWPWRIGYMIAALIVFISFLVINRSLDTASRALKSAERSRKQLASSLDSLHERESLLRTVVDEMPDVLVLKDQNGNFLLANETVAKLYNTTPEQMVGKHDGDFGVPSKMAEFFRQNVLKIMEKGETEVVYEDSKDAKTGEIRHFKSVKKPFKGIDGQNQILVIAQDITDLIATQHDLAESEERLSTILDNVDAFIYLKDTEGRYLFANQAVRDLWRVGMDDIIGSKDDGFFDEETVANIIKNDRLVLDKGETFHAIEVNTVPETGITRTYQSTKLPLRNEHGEIYALCGISVDITDIKSSESALRESEQRFKMAGKAAYDLIYEWDVASDTLTWFGDVDAMLGFPKGKVSHQIQAWLELIHPEDVEQLADAVERHRESTQPIHYEYRIADSQGRYRYWSDRALPMINEEGHPYKWVGVCADITLQKDQQQKLEHSAYYDPLTGLPNRSLLTDRLKQAMSQCHRRKQQVAVVYIDLDGFKEVNDTYGHEVGDKLLIAIGNRIQSHLREGDTISRLGGDEFVAVLSDLDNSYAAVPMLDRLLQATSQPIMHEDLILQVSASLGVTYYPQSDEIAPDQLLRQADQAMYQAKLNGKNRYFLFDTENDRSLRGQSESDEHIERALQHQEFELYYQPKVNMHSGEVIGMEALLRWNHPDKGLLLPGEFLTGMENHQLTNKIGDWVIRSALSQISDWTIAGAPYQVSVNVAGSQLQQGFVEKLDEVLREFPNIEPEMLQLEVLESSALQDINLVSEVMRGCEEIGVSFALDDFGTGYSSLTYLKYLPAEVLKIDRSFVRDMLDDPDDMAILEGVMGMSSAFRRKVVAEGVERIEQGVFLLRLGCDLAQGYAIAKPMPASQVLDWVSSWHPPEQWQIQSRVRREDLAILFAEVEHRAWVRTLDSYIANPDLPLPPLSPHQCRFGQWWDEEGKYRYPDGVSALLSDLHQRVHHCGVEIQKAVEREEFDKAAAYQTEIHEVSSELINELDRILNSLYSSQI